MNSHADTTGSNATTRAIGGELRRRRETKGWSRKQLSDRLPSSLDAMTLHAHEANANALTLSQFVDVCWALGERPCAVLEHALDRVMSGEDAQRPPRHADDNITKGR